MKDDETDASLGWITFMGNIKNEMPRANAVLTGIVDAEFEDVCLFEEMERGKHDEG